jgi:ankyrin repeat protein
MVVLLLGNGADPLATNNDGATALDSARENGHAELATLLRHAAEKETKP